MNPLSAPLTPPISLLSFISICIPGVKEDTGPGDVAPRARPTGSLGVRGVDVIFYRQMLLEC
jgi:hypothetical protein